MNDSILYKANGEKWRTKFSDFLLRGLEKSFSAELDCKVWNLPNGDFIVKDRDQTGTLPVTNDVPTEADNKVFAQACQNWATDMKKILSL